MKGSRSERIKRIILNQESYQTQEKISKTDRFSMASCIGPSKKFFFPDPFREIDKDIPNSKLKPIIIRKKISPCIKTPKAASLRLSHKSEQEAMNYNLPILKFRNDESVKKCLDSTERKSFNQKSSVNLIQKNKNFKILDEDQNGSENFYFNSNVLEVSFGNPSQKFTGKKKLPYNS